MGSGTRRRTVKCNKAKKACRTIEKCPHAVIHKEHYAYENSLHDSGKPCTTEALCVFRNIDVVCEEPSVADYIAAIRGTLLGK